MQKKRKFHRAYGSSTPDRLSENLCTLVGLSSAELKACIADDAPKMIEHENKRAWLPQRLWAVYDNGVSRAGRRW